MRESVYVILTILSTIILMLITSMLLDWAWIQQHWSRKFVVVLLMAIELFHGFLVYSMISKHISRHL